MSQKLLDELKRLDSTEELLFRSADRVLHISLWRRGVFDGKVRTAETAISFYTLDSSQADMLAVIVRNIREQLDARALVEDIEEQT